MRPGFSRTGGGSAARVASSFDDFDLCGPAHVADVNGDGAADWLLSGESGNSFVGFEIRWPTRKGFGTKRLPGIVNVWDTNHSRALDTAVKTGAGSSLSARFSPCGAVQIAVNADRAYALTVALPEQHADAVASAVRTAFSSDSCSMRADAISPTELRITLVGTLEPAPFQPLSPPPT